MTLVAPIVLHAEATLPVTQSAPLSSVSPDSKTHSSLLWMDEDTLVAYVSWRLAGLPGGAELLWRCEIRKGRQDEKEEQKEEEDGGRKLFSLHQFMLNQKQVDLFIPPAHLARVSLSLLFQLGAPCPPPPSLCPSFHLSPSPRWFSLASALFFTEWGQSEFEQEGYSASVSASCATTHSD